MNRINYITRGVCSREIIITVCDDGETLEHVEFIGGCEGNTKGVASLCKGMKIDELINRLEGITCGQKETSCPNELALALIKYKNAK